MRRGHDYNRRVSVRVIGPDRSRWAVDPDWLSQAIIIVLSILAPAFLGDDAWTFNYVNNVEGAQPLYFHNGYVHLVPQLTGYAVGGLPFPLQAMLYRVVPLICALCFYRQLRLLLAAAGDPRDASLQALAIVFVVRVVEPLVFGELASSIWTAFLAAYLYVTRIHLVGGRYSWRGTAGILLAVFSLPLGMLLVPLWLVYARQNIGAQRRHNLALAITVAVGYLWMLARAPDLPRGVSNPLSLVEMFVDGFRDEKRDNLIALGSLTVLAAHAAADLWIARERRHDLVRTARWSLGYLGVASIVAFVVSDRFVWLDGNFVARYTLPSVTCALILSGISIGGLATERTRTLVTGAAIGSAIAVLLVLIYTQLRGPLEISLMRYRFLSLGTEFRATCRGDDAMLFEYTDASPIILCRPRPLAPGYHPMPALDPSLGTGTKDVEGLPGIFVFTPLF